MKSIFERLDETVKEHGCVPEGYELEGVYKPSEIPPSVLGEEEGFMSRHSVAAPDDMVKKAVDLIGETVKMNPRLAVHSYDDEEIGFKVATIRGSLIKNIIENIHEYDPHKLSTLAYSLVEFGTKMETVKLGLLLLVLFDFADDEVVRRHLVTVGMHEEFTGYVIANAKGWPSEIKNQVFYIYGKTLNGWGKINAVDAIEPINDEIKEWLLCHGCSNNISYGHLGRIVYDKCGLRERLIKGGLSTEEMQGARDIMRGLIVGTGEGNINSIEDPAGLIKAYLKEQVSHAVKLEDVSNMFKLRDLLREWDKNGTNPDAAASVKLIDRILALSDTVGMIREGLLYDPDIAVNAAREGGIDISQELLAHLREEFNMYYVYAPYFLEEEINIGEFIDICEERLSNSDANVAPSDTPEPGDEKWHLDRVLKYLGRYPGLGEDIVIEAIGSVNPAYRMIAASVIKQWEETRGRNIKKISTDVFHAIKKVRKKEPDPAIRSEWDAVSDYK